MHMQESSESCHRVVNMSQTKRVIQFDARKSDYEEQLQPFPYTVVPLQNGQLYKQRLPPPPTPTKFVPAEFRDTDYESEVESTRIRPLWTPNQSDSDEPQYRRVRAPTPTRSASVPRSYGARVLTPMEYDNKPIELPSKITFPIESPSPKFFQQTHTLDRFSSKKSQSKNISSTQYKTTRDDITLRPSSPPIYGIMQNLNQNNPLQNVSSSIKAKANKFFNNIASDSSSSSKQKSGLKSQDTTDNNGGPQAYREESRVSQYGE